MPLAATLTKTSPLLGGVNSTSIISKGLFSSNNTAAFVFRFIIIG